jgi:DNA-binding MarR family transcriptional regulator
MALKLGRGNARKDGRQPVRRSGDGTGAHGDLAAALDALRRIVRALGVSSRTAEHTAGITGAQLLVLQRLSESPAHSLNDLAERTFTHQSTVSVVVDRLVARRFVKRERSKEDARKILLSLTTTGRAALRKAPPPAQTQLIDALRRLPQRQLRAIRDGLTTAATTMGLAEVTPLLFFDDDDGEARRPRRSRRD